MQSLITSELYNIEQNIKIGNKGKKNRSEKFCCQEWCVFECSRLVSFPWAAASHKKALTQHLYSFQLFKFHNFPVFHDLWNTWHFRKFSNPLLFQGIFYLTHFKRHETLDLVFKLESTKLVLFTLFNKIVTCLYFNTSLL